MKPKEPPLFILLLLVSFASVSAVLFTPALPEITQQFGISSAQAQLTMSVFLIGYAIGNLPYGPLSNRFGRKLTAYVGIALAIVGSLLVVLTSQFQLFWLFIFGRFLMALGSSVGIKIAFTMVGDVYKNEEATKKISYLMLAFAIGPGLAIALGGFLTKQFGWESCFYFLVAYSAFVFIMTLFLPETSKELDVEALNFTRIKEGYFIKLKNKNLVTCALLMGCGTSFVYLFASEAPFIGINYLGLSADTYGLLNFIPPIGMIVGSLFAHALAGKKDVISTIFLGILISLIASALMLVLFLLGQATVWSLFIPMPFIYIGLSLVFPNVSALAMTHAKNKSNASAMMNFINMGVSVLVLFLVESLPTHKIFLMPFIFTVIAVIMLFLKAHLPAHSTSTR